MGCCQSTTASQSPHDATSAQHQRRANSLALAIAENHNYTTGPTTTAANVNNASSHSSPAPSPHRSTTRLPRLISSRTASATTTRPNRNLRAPSPVPRSPRNISLQHPPPWTRAVLDREREAFFDTRVTGRAEIWNALRFVCELLRAGDVVGAQGIMDAVLLTCPSGRVAKGYSKQSRSGGGAERVKGGVYDERGELYEIPDWVVADPEDIVEGEDEDDDDDEIVDNERDDYTHDAEEDEDDDDEEKSPSDLTSPKPRSRRRTLTSSSSLSPADEKGKGRAESPGEPLPVRLRLSDRIPDLDLVVYTKQPVAILARQVREQARVRRVRLVYLGRVLDERKTLVQNGWGHGHVVNALVMDSLGK